MFPPPCSQLSSFQLFTIGFNLSNLVPTSLDSFSPYFPPQAHCSPLIFSSFFHRSSLILSFFCRILIFLHSFIIILPFFFHFHFSSLYNFLLFLAFRSRNITPSFPLSNPFSPLLPHHFLLGTHAVTPLSHIINLLGGGDLITPLLLGIQLWELWLFLYFGPQSFPFSSFGPLLGKFFGINSLQWSLMGYI